MFKVLIVLHILEYFAGYCSAYEYGYFPISEKKFERKTWTRLPPIANDRRRLWSDRNREYFAPKFSIVKNRPKFTTSSLSYGHSDNDRDIFNGPNLDSHFGFQTSSSASDIDSVGNIPLGDNEPTTTTKSPLVTATSVSSTKNHHPIYFTNPRTGIVYAITEIGAADAMDIGFSKDQQANDNDKSSIPIFITKKQYDQDILLLKKKYETSCKLELPTHSNSTKITPISHDVTNVISPPNTITTKPHIIRLINSTKKSKLPPETIVTAQLNVKNPLTSIKRRKLNKSSQKKVENFRKTTNESSIGGGPLIIFGNRKRKIESQLEKPTSILVLNKKFGQNAQRYSSKRRDHKISRRSTNSIVVPATSVGNSKTPPVVIPVKSIKDIPLLPCRNTTTKSLKKKNKKHKQIEGIADDGDYFGDESNSSDYDTSSYEQESEASTENSIIRRESSSSEDDDDDDFPNVSSLVRGISFPMKMAINKVSDILLPDEKDIDDYNDEDYDKRKPKYPLYTEYYHSSDVSHEINDNSISSWLGSWFGLTQRNRKKPIDEQNWFESWWFGNSDGTASTDDNVDDDGQSGNWFFGFFDTKRRSKRTTTTTQVPILTIANPLNNTQSWIGILAQHIINSTSTTTRLPYLTTPTIENPDISKKISYEKYQIWRLKLQNNQQLNAIKDFVESEEGSKLLWLAGPSLRGLSDVLIPFEMVNEFQGTLSFESIYHDILIYDVGKAIAYEQTTSIESQPNNIAITSSSTKMSSNFNKNNKHKRPPPTMLWNKYHRYDTIVKYLEQIQMRNPQLIELIHVGRSYEGRPLIIVKIESRQSDATRPAAMQTISNMSSSSSSSSLSAIKKRLQFKRKSGHQANAVFIEAGVHGHEWVAPATANWIISEVLRIMKSNKTNSDTLHIRKTTWYVMPMLNPDGYEHSHVYDRMWSKSRSRHISKPSGIIDSAMTWLQQKNWEQICYGVDLNHNWHYQWGRNGANQSPCNQFYIGPASFSEPETRALSKFLMDYRKEIKLFISLQSYGQIISFPFMQPISDAFQSEKDADLIDAAIVGTDGLRIGGKSRYKIDLVNDLVQRRSGSSDSFALHEANIRFAYTIHLGDNGVHGYLLPSTRIESTARDAFEIIASMIDYIQF